MHTEIQKIITVLSEDIKGTIPNKFEEQYYLKMAYSKQNKILKLEKNLLIETISFEVAFVHIVVFIFSKCFNLGNYSSLLENLDDNKLFSWYKMTDRFIEDYLNCIDIQGFSDIHKLINQHDTFINKEVKKNLGQFYTPENLVKKTIFEIKGKLKSITNKDLIIDPACGTGIFLVEIIKELKRVLPRGEVIKYVRDNIFGYDVNPFAVIATKINIVYILLKEFPEETEIISRLFDNYDSPLKIMWKNTVEENDSNTYSIILGNPPYFKLNHELIKNIKGYDEIIFGQPNIYSFFMFWAIQHLNQDGTMSFIVPQSIRSGLYFKNLRDKMKDLRITSVIHIDSRQNLFDRAEQAVLIICLENKSIANTKTKIQFCDGSGNVNTQFKIPRKKLMMKRKDNHIFVINKRKEMYNILDKVYQNGFFLDDGKSEVKFSNGLFVWNQHKEDIVDEEFSAIPIIYGGNIQPLNFNFSMCSTNKEKKKYSKITNKTKGFVLSGKRLLIQRTTNFERDIRLKACLISDDFLKENQEYFLENHVNFLCSISNKQEILSLDTMYYYLGLLNSKLVNHIFVSQSGNTQVSANELNSLPFPKKGYEEISKFVSRYSEQLIEHQQELDIIVCRSYGLSADETNFIINY